MEKRLSSATTPGCRNGTAAIIVSALTEDHKNISDDAGLATLPAEPATFILKGL